MIGSLLDFLCQWDEQIILNVPLNPGASAWIRLNTPGHEDPAPKGHSDSPFSHSDTSVHKTLDLEPDWSQTGL